MDKQKKEKDNELTKKNEIEQERINHQKKI